MDVVFSLLFTIALVVGVIWFVCKIDVESKKDNLEENSQELEKDDENLKSYTNNLMRECGISEQDYLKLIENEHKKLVEYANTICEQAYELYSNNLWNKKAKRFGELLLVYNAYTDRFYIGNELHGFISPKTSEENYYKMNVYTAGIIDSHTESSALKDTLINYDDLEYLSDNIDEAYLEFNDFVEDILNKYKEI